MEKKQFCWKLFKDFEREYVGCLEMERIVDMSVGEIEKHGLLSYMRGVSVELFNEGIKRKYVHALFEFSVGLDRRLKSKTWYTTEQLVDALTEIFVEIDIDCKNSSWLFPCFVIVTVFMCLKLFVG